MSEKLFETGRKIRTDVLGEERVRKVLDGADAFNKDFQRLVTEYCWGFCWATVAPPSRHINDSSRTIVSSLPHHIADTVASVRTVVIQCHPCLFLAIP